VNTCANAAPLTVRHARTTPATMCFFIMTTSSNRFPRSELPHLPDTVPFEGWIERFADRSHADHDLADRAGEFVVIRLVVVRHRCQIVHAHIGWLGADEERNGAIDPARSHLFTVD